MGYCFHSVAPLRAPTSLVLGCASARVWHFQEPEPNGKKYEDLLKNSDLKGFGGEVRLGRHFNLT